jgi:peptidyl-prolyl cis-trans isomerase SurA
MIEKKGDYVNVRHILLQAKVSPVDLYNAKKELDSIAVLIKDGKITFEEAAVKFSDDPGKSGGGLVINAQTGSTWFEMNELDPQMSFVINDLEIGEISNAVPMKTDENMDAFRLVKLKGRSEPHRANLESDYFIIHALALRQKQKDKESEWVQRNIKNAYIRISDRYKDCPFRYEWIQEID